MRAKCEGVPPGRSPVGQGDSGPVAASAESEMPGCARRQARPLSFTYLAATGPPTSGLAILAGLLLATGSAVLVFTRRQIAARHRH
jgi:hypothetical protein